MKKILSVIATPFLLVTATPEAGIEQAVKAQSAALVVHEAYIIDLQEKVTNLDNRLQEVERYLRSTSNKPIQVEVKQPRINWTLYNHLKRHG